MSIRACFKFGKARCWRASLRAWTLVEMMVALAIFSLGMAALCSFYLFSIRSLASMANYASLDAENREAMDRLTQEIRQATAVENCITNGDSTSITVLEPDTNGDAIPVTYLFSATNSELSRITGGDSTVLLTNCDLLNFELFQRNPSNGNYGVFPVASSDWTQTVKVVQLTWKTARSLPSGLVNSENIQTARIVIRKQQNN
jgi:prepilin-type N-terminal cleavage/methylation domain-containing protein